MKIFDRLLSGQNFVFIPSNIFKEQVDIKENGHYCLMWEFNCTPALHLVLS